MHRQSARIFGPRDKLGFTDLGMVAQISNDLIRFAVQVLILKTMVYSNVIRLLEFKAPGDDLDLVQNLGMIKMYTRIRVNWSWLTTIQKGLCHS